MPIPSFLRKDIIGYSEEQDRIIVFLRKKASKKTISYLKQVEEEYGKRIEVYVLEGNLKIL